MATVTSVVKFAIPADECFQLALAVGLKIEGPRGWRKGPLDWDAKRVTWKWGGWFWGNIGEVTATFEADGHNTRATFVGKNIMLHDMLGILERDMNRYYVEPLSYVVTQALADRQGRNDTKER